LIDISICLSAGHHHYIILSIATYIMW